MHIFSWHEVRGALDGILVASGWGRCSHEGCMKYVTDMWVDEHVQATTLAETQPRVCCYQHVRCMFLLPVHCGQTMTLFIRNPCEKPT